MYADPDGVTLVIQSNDQPDTAGTKVLQVDPNNDAANTDVDLWDTWAGVQGLQAHTTPDFQEWTLVGVPGQSAYGLLKNKKTGTCLASTSAKGWLTTAPCDAGDQNQWFWLFAL